MQGTTKVAIVSNVDTLSLIREKFRHEITLRTPAIRVNWPMHPLPCYNLMFISADVK